MNKISNQKIPLFTPTPGMVLAAENVFNAMAHEQTVRPVVEAYQNAILADGKWRVRAEHTRSLEQEVITNREHSFLMSDADFDIYLARCKIARDQAGLKVEQENQCPLLVAENMLNKSRLAMMHAMSEITKIKEPSSLPIATFKQLAELTLRLLAPFVASKTPDLPT